MIRNREKEFTPFFSEEESLVFYKDIPVLILQLPSTVHDPGLTKHFVMLGYIF